MQALVWPKLSRRNALMPSASESLKLFCAVAGNCAANKSAAQQRNRMVVLMFMQCSSGFRLRPMFARDSEREREHGHGGEARVLQELTEGEGGHSWRKASIGSMRVARCAGKELESSATRLNAPITSAKISCVFGSQPPPRLTWLQSTRWTPRFTTIPTPNP